MKDKNKYTPTIMKYGKIEIYVGAALCQVYKGRKNLGTFTTLSAAKKFVEKQKQ